MLSRTVREPCCLNSIYLGKAHVPARLLAPLSPLFVFSPHPREGLLAGERRVEVGLLTNDNVRCLGPTFERAWPVEEASSFSELLRAIDEVDRELLRVKGEL